MTALVASLTGTRVAVDVNKMVWAVSSLLMAAVAVNVLPLVAGAVAYYAASKSKNGYLKAIAVAATVAGVVLGVLAAI